MHSLHSTAQPPMTTVNYVFLDCYCYLGMDSTAKTKEPNSTKMCFKALFSWKVVNNYLDPRHNLWAKSCSNVQVFGSVLGVVRVFHRRRARHPHSQSVLVQHRNTSPGDYFGDSRGAASSPVHNVGQKAPIGGKPPGVSDNYTE